ncbi:disintegrin and metalloproteinase domain-containing protein 10-like [Tropilaelaps mercedesae]|uniref:Disintegrin and metalloproteinase domain-containing protein 10-like n=1 Tax=Tropilaelaps mercedesae TaxID=418985 RepID=A0A1V9XMF8_9ACAR|nr:disintegrin and metalloproteinase domain-containing protein 10-like [Tropilaelaps mercedesae]
MNEFLERPNLPNAANYCVIVHLTNDDPNGYAGFGKLSGMCSEPNYEARVMSMVLRVPDQQWTTDLTFVHEIGHLFGAPHDGVPGLIPGNIHCPLSENEPINYIMHPRTRITFHENQRKFSPCSIRSIQNHLSIIFTSGAYKKCLDVFSENTCGIDTETNRCVLGDIDPEFTVDSCWPPKFHTSSELSGTWTNEFLSRYDFNSQCVIDF